MLSLEPVFCKSTGAYRAQVSHFCHFKPSIEGSFKLSRARKPALIDSNCWRTSLQASELRVNKNVLIKHGVRSILSRGETNVTVLIAPENGFIVELPSQDLPQDLSADGLVTMLKERYRTDFNSMAVTLIRHGILNLDNEALIRASRSTGTFQVENCVEILRIENRTLLRSILSGRVVDMTENPYVTVLTESRDVYQAEEENVPAFEYLCRLGMFRQIWSQK